MARTGKIARLPRSIRDQLNRRLDDGEYGACLVDWLNAQPDVQRVLKEQFGGRPINEQNLSDWKQGGFQDWLRHQESCAWVRTLADEDDHIAEEAGTLPLSDRLSSVVALKIGRLLREFSDDSLADAGRRKEFLFLLRELARVRRSDHCATRLRMDVESYKRKVEYRRRAAEVNAAYMAHINAPYVPLPSS